MAHVEVEEAEEPPFDEINRHLLPVQYNLDFPQTVRVQIGDAAYDFTYRFNNLPGGGLILTCYRVSDQQLMFSKPMRKYSLINVVDPTTYETLFALFPEFVEEDNISIWVLHLDLEFFVDADQ